MPVPIFRGRVQRGKVVFSDRDAVNDFVSSLEGKQVEIIIREREYGRSLDQNAYYHAVVIKMLSEETGYEVGEVHREMKRMFLKRPDTKGLPSTAVLNVKEFTEYIEQIRRFAAQHLDVNIPDPENVYV